MMEMMSTSRDESIINSNNKMEGPGDFYTGEKIK